MREFVNDIQSIDQALILGQGKGGFYQVDTAGYNTITVINQPTSLAPIRIDQQGGLRLLPGESFVIKGNSNEISQFKLAIYFSAVFGPLGFQRATALVIKKRYI